MTVMGYQLRDLKSGNCLGAYAEEAAALADVRARQTRMVWLLDAL